MIDQAKQIESFCRFFRGEGLFEGLSLSNLPCQYTWPKRGEFPRLLNLDLRGTNFEKNIQLKRHFGGLWAREDHLELARWIISDWGGIKTNSDSTLQKYVAGIEDGTLELSISGVASYSKILSFVYPHRYAIYDARVAASLNLIQIIDETENPVLWCDLPGRNSKIEGFKQDEGRRAELKKFGWQQVKRTECYRNYNNMLKTVLSYFPQSCLYELEMSLFANAESLVDLLRSRYD